MPVRTSTRAWSQGGGRLCLRPPRASRRGSTHEPPWAWPKTHAPGVGRTPCGRRPSSLSFARGPSIRHRGPGRHALGQPESTAGGGGFGPAASIVQQEERLEVFFAPLLFCCVTRNPRRGCTRRSSNFNASSTSSGGTHVEVEQLGHYGIAFAVRKGNLFEVLRRVIQGNAPPSSRRAILARHQKAAPPR